MTNLTGIDLSIEATQYSPKIQTDWQRGRIQMVGESYPENTYEFFSQLIAWTESFLEESSEPLLLELQLSYLNTSSIRAMIDIFDMLQDAADNGRDIRVAWQYDERNPRASELGEEFKEDYTFNFDIISVGA
jgi:SiaC family regulatory phosphoprotein